MIKEPPQLFDMVSKVGPAPEGVEQIDFIIAEFPARELTRAAKNSTFSYAGLEAAVEKDPDLLERLDSSPLPSKSLADDILLRQQHLSRHMRRLATLSSVLVLGLGGFTFGYKSTMETQREVLHPNSNTPQEQVHDTPEALQNGAIFGGLTAFLGGTIVYLSSLPLSGRMARRPARKLVDKAKVAEIQS